jgi:uncharacterized protein (TIGR02099 family)
VNPLWQRVLHRCARALGWTAGTAVILLAVLMALTQLLLPLLARHPQWVAAQLSQRLQRPVSFASLEGRWTPSGPLFVMHNVTVGAAAGETGDMLQLPESELKLDFGGWLLPSRHLLNLYVRGLQVDLARDADGSWHVNGIGLAGDASRQPLSLGRFSIDLWLEDLRVVITDAKHGKSYALLSPQFRLSWQGTQIRIGGRLRREGEAAAFRTAGRFRADGSSGQLWINADDVDLKPLLDGVDLDGYLPQGHGRLASWLDWHKGRVTSSVSRFDLDRLTVTAPSGAYASVSALHGLAGLRRTGDGYEVRWASDDGGALALALHQPGTPQFSVDLAARELQLSPLLPWLALKPDLAPALAQWVGGGHPRGSLTRLALKWSQGDGLQQVDLAFKNLGIDAVGKLPGVNQLQGELRGDAEALSLELPAQVSTLQFPHLFRQPFVLSKLDGTLAFWMQDGDPHLGADTLDFVGDGYAGYARGEVTLQAQGAPFLDLYASVDHADVPAAKLFWPINSMPPPTIAWLDRALVSGNVDQAQVLVRGDLADWPFHHNEGRFEARAVISDLTFDYGNQWPRAEGVGAVANFINSGMLIEASGGQSLGVKADKATALIPDFGDGLLDLNVQGNGSGADLMEFVRKSPIGIHQADTLAKLNLGGSGTFDFHLALPLKKDAVAQLSGSAQLKDADFSAPDWNLKLDKLNGPLHFDARGAQAGLQANSLDAAYHGRPAKLQLAIAAANSDPNTILSAQLQGSYSIAELVQDYPTLKWLGQLGDGRSDFTVGYALTHVSGSTATAQILSVDSPLSGTSLDLPAPLNKPAAASMPLHVGMSLPVSGSDLQFALGQVARGHLRLAAGAQQPMAATLAFGNQLPDGLPARDLRIRGHAGQLDVTGWVAHAAAGAGSGGPGLESLDVSMDQAGWFGHSLGAMKIQLKPQAEGLSADVDGAAMVGNFTIPTDLDKRGLTARLQRLYWPKDTAAETAAAAGAPTTDPANTGINPAALPPFHLYVEDLRLGDAKLGEARLETWPTASGMHVEQLRALSSSVQINASGDWNGSPSNSHTHLKIGFASEDLGTMLGAFGFEGMVNGGKTNDQLDASWPGAPSALSLANMDGTLSIHVSNGRIPEATTPMKGRLLGLVSLFELPRRLSLDFGDVFGKGLAFDSITGDFHLAGGNATTTNLFMKGPAANISITGRTGLRAKDFDQQVWVMPHVGNSLPLVGAVVGGPIGAAAGFAMQGLLGGRFSKAASARYQITGSWDKPVMTLIEKREIGAPPAVPLLNPTGSLPGAAGNGGTPAASRSAGR